MPRVFSVLLTSVLDWFRSRVSMQMELIALRHQVAVYKQSISRPKLRPADRFLWAWLSRLWPGWQGTLEFVQPRTVLAWQKKRFRDYWRRLSQSGKPGRPPISKEVRELIRDMWRANPTWGSPRIVGELRTQILLKNETVVKILGHVYPLRALCNVTVVWSRLSARDSRIMSRAIRPSKQTLLRHIPSHLVVPP